MLKIGITGGIATGKSTVCSELSKKGYPVIDCDLLVHESYLEGGEMYLSVLGAFGPRILGVDGNIDRKILSQIVFSSSEALKLLNEMTHPIVLKMIGERVEAFRGEGQELVFVDVPLLFEAKMESQFDCTVLVDTSESLQLERLMARNNFDLQEANRRISAQMPLVEKRSLATFIIENRGGLEELSQALEKLIFELNLLNKKA